jgi:hypothetical protein
MPLNRLFDSISKIQLFKAKFNIYNYLQNSHES